MRFSQCIYAEKLFLGRLWLELEGTWVKEFSKLCSMYVITDLGGLRSSQNQSCAGQSLLSGVHAVFISPLIEHELYSESLKWGHAEGRACKGMKERKGRGCIPSQDIWKWNLYIPFVVLGGCQGAFFKRLPLAWLLA